MGKQRIRGRSMIIAVVPLCAAIVFLAGFHASGQTAGLTASRTFDGRPDFNGIWQALGTAHWDIQDHSAQPGPPAFGALFATPGGQGVVEGNEIPYQPWAALQKAENFKNRFTSDPVAKCFLPGVPRATYMPFPFRIFQTPRYIMIVYEFARAVRTIHMVEPKPNPFPTWMGHSVGRWDGDTLVVDVKDLVADTWFDQAGNFHSEALQVTERYTLMKSDHVHYEVTINDPQVFTRPWRMSMPLYRRMDSNVQLVEFNCVEFAEEMMFGHLRKPPSN